MAKRLSLADYQTLYRALKSMPDLEIELDDCVDRREARELVRQRAKNCGFTLATIIDRHDLVVDLCCFWDLYIEPHPDDDPDRWRATATPAGEDKPKASDPAKWPDDVFVRWTTLPQDLAFTRNPTTPKETTMNTITVETRTFINGRDAKSFSDAEIYTLISQQEAKIAELNAITNKPQRLLDEVAKRQDGIDALVQYLNDKDAPAA